jgi:alpha-ketoglutarate-dependent taurine dioxygenase
MLSPIKADQGFRRIEVLPLAGSMGAEIRGVDLRRPVDVGTRQEIFDAFRDYLVVYFPDQDITHQQHLDFARLFGPIITLPQIFKMPEHPELQLISREADAKGRVVGEAWHTDSSFLEKPPRCIVMRAVDVPEYGGDTAFSNLYLAYEMLSPKMKDILGQMRAVHSAVRLFGSRQEHDEKVRSFKFPDIKEGVGERETTHPVICTHPVSGRKFIYVNTVFVQRFDGMTEEESAPLLKYLYEHCAKIDFTCRVHWRKNQVLIWDNRATYHRAIADYDGFARHMVRATVEGPRPS